MSINLSNQMDNFEYSNHHIAILLRQTFWFTDKIIEQIFEIQNKQKIRWINASIGDILFKNKTINDKFKSKEQFLIFLDSKWFPLRLWEKLLVSHKLSSSELEKALEVFYTSNKSNHNLLIWDVLLDNEVISANDLIGYLEQSRVRLRVWEILIIKWLIEHSELSELLLIQETLKNKWKHIHLIDVLNTKKKWKTWLFSSSKPDFIDDSLLKDILWFQKLSVLKVLDTSNVARNQMYWVEVGDAELDDDKFYRIFWKVKHNTPDNINKTNDDVDPWANEAYHPVLRKF